MGGNHGFKDVKRSNHLTKSQNFNKPGKADQHTRDKYWNWGGREKYKEYVNQEFGIKFKTNDTNFYLDSRQNSNTDTSHMTEEEIIDLNTQLYEDYYKNIPSDWENFNDRTRWRVEKNRSKERRRDADMKMDR
jgi:hypothetical protein